MLTEETEHGRYCIIFRVPTREVHRENYKWWHQISEGVRDKAIFSHHNTLKVLDGVPSLFFVKCVVNSEQIVWLSYVHHMLACWPSCGGARSIQLKCRRNHGAFLVLLMAGIKSSLLICLFKFLWIEQWQKTEMFCSATSQLKNWMATTRLGIGIDGEPQTTICSVTINHIWPFLPEQNLNKTFQKCFCPPVENQLQRLFVQLIMIANTLWKKNFSDHLKSFLFLGTMPVAKRLGYGMGRLKTLVLSSKVANKTRLKIIQDWIVIFKKEL